MEPEEAKREGGGTQISTTKKLAKKIARAVREKLEGASLHNMSEKKIREELSAVLKLDLSEDPYKSIVRRAVEDHLEYEVREGRAKRKARAFAQAQSRGLAQQNDKL